MRLHAEHEFDASPEAVVSALVDPAFAVELRALPDVGSVEVVDHGADDPARWISVRLVYSGSLDGVASKVLGPTAPSWVQTYRFDGDDEGTLQIVPETHGTLLDCSAEITLQAIGGATRRTVEGSLTVKVPLIGGRAERALAPAIVARIDVEARLLTEWLSRD